MSWDVCLTEIYEACEHCGREREERVVFDRNYTSNMWPMLTRAGFDWDVIKGKKARDCFLTIHGLIEAMESDPEGYKALNPSNGWGDYENFLWFLRDFRTALTGYPNAVFDISR